jgi:hypothetical protein
MVLAVLAFVVGVVTLPSQAATINVAAGEVAVILNGKCSLREAILNVEAGSDTYSDCVAVGAYTGDDIISLAAGSTYVATPRRSSGTLLCSVAQLAEESEPSFGSST